MNNCYYRPGEDCTLRTVLTAAARRRFPGGCTVEWSVPAGRLSACRRSALAFHRRRHQLSGCPRRTPVLGSVPDPASRSTPCDTKATQGSSRVQGQFKVVHSFLEHNLKHVFFLMSPYVLIFSYTYELFQIILAYWHWLSFCITYNRQYDEHYLCSINPQRLHIVTIIIIIIIIILKALGCEVTRGRKAKRKNVKTTGMTRGPVRR